jgi:NTE family protein
MERPRIALALGSGAGRGWAHIGVLRALQREGLRIDIVCGTSIGALVGGVWLAGHIDTLETWARSLNRMRILRYLDVAILRGGLIGGRRIERLLVDNLSGLKVEALPKPFAAVATELETGHEIWLQTGDLVQALKAAYALPGVFPPVEIDGRLLVDGALVNPVPVSVCRALGARLVVAVNLNADLIGRGRRPGKHKPTTPEALGRGLIARDPAGGGALGHFLGGDGGPSVFSVMSSSLNILQDRLGRSRLAGDPPDVTIAPRLGHVALLEFDRAPEVIAEGEAAVERAKPFLHEALKVLGF